MAGNFFLDLGLINADFWSAWPRRFYNIKHYDATKNCYDTDKQQNGDGDNVNDCDGAEQKQTKKVRCIFLIDTFIYNSKYFM